MMTGLCLSRWVIGNPADLGDTCGQFVVVAFRGDAVRDGLPADRERDTHGDVGYL